MKMIVCLIQTRMKSTRLPGKCMTKIADEPMTSYVIKAAQLSKKIDFTGIIYPDTNEDKEIFYNNYYNKCYCFAGDENNVLKRYYDAVKNIEELTQRKIKHVIRLTSDCPLLAYNSELIDNVIEYHIDNNNEFTHNRGDYGYPSGFDVEIMTKDVFEECYKNAKTEQEKEHVTLYIKNNKNDFAIGEYNLPNKIHDLSRYRNWSVDTKEDMIKIREFIDLLLLIKGDIFDE
jgi:spore coat polysaccharide biosynthesis protein SpsF (cytidylyltransferase family)